MDGVEGGVRKERTRARKGMRRTRSSQYRRKLWELGDAVNDGIAFILTRGWTSFFVDLLQVFVAERADKLSKIEGEMLYAIPLSYTRAVGMACLRSVVLGTTRSSVSTTARPYRRRKSPPVECHCD
jgi:hypothetical protein